MENQTKYFKGIIPPPIVFFAFLLIGFAAHWIMPLEFIFHEQYVRFAVGIPISIVSGCIALNAFVIMKKNKTAINFNSQTTKIITKGSFLFTRNPLYLALLLLLGSIAILANSIWFLVLVIPLFIIFNFSVVPREERYLKERFGEEYIRYKNKVRRWI